MLSETFISKALIGIAIATLMLSMPCFGQAWSSFLDTSRAIDWTSAGFTIPSYSTACSGSPPSLLTGSANAAANTTAIQNALATCDATHNVVNLPSGTYYVAGITYPTQGKMVMRGAGSSAPGNTCAAGSTCLILTSTVGCTGLAAGICMNGSNTYSGGAPVLPPSGTQQCAWTAGYAQGTTSITLNSCGSSSPASTGLAANNLIILDQANDLTDNGGIYMCDSSTSSDVGGGICTLNDGTGANYDGRRIALAGITYTYSQKQVAKIVSVSGSGTGPYTVVITPGVYFNNIRSGQSPGAWWAGTITLEGLENVYIDGSAISPFNVEIAGCYKCWIKGISSYNAQRSHVQTGYSANTVIRDSYFFESQAHASESYVYEPEQTSAELVENNIFQQVTNPTITGNTSGSVFDYNICIGSVYTSPNYLQASYLSHNAGNDMNLYEGNNCLNFASDDTWGSSNTETLFRNFLTGWQHQSSGPIYDTSTFIDRSFSRAHNLIGNVLGQPSYHNTYQSYANTSSSGVNFTSVATAIYSLGGTGSSETTSLTCVLPSSSTACDPVVFNTLMRWGNYDTVTAGVKWDSTEASPAAVQYVNANFTSTYFGSLVHTLPNSLYYTSVPTTTGCGTGLGFWKNPTLGTCPIFPPFGPDVSAGNVGTCSGGTYPGAQATSAGQCTGGTLATAWASHATAIPAQVCYLSVMNGVPDGTGSMLAFNPSACYASDPLINVPAPFSTFFAGNFLLLGNGQLSLK